MQEVETYIYVNTKQAAFVCDAYTYSVLRASMYVH